MEKYYYSQITFNGEKEKVNELIVEMELHSELSDILFFTKYNYSFLTTYFDKQITYSKRLYLNDTIQINIISQHCPPFDFMFVLKQELGLRTTIKYKEIDIEELVSRHSLTKTENIGFDIFKL